MTAAGITEGASRALTKADPFAHERRVGDNPWVERPVPNWPTSGLILNIAWVIVSIAAGIGVWGLMDALNLFARTFHLGGNT